MPKADGELFQAISRRQSTNMVFVRIWMFLQITSFIDVITLFVDTSIVIAFLPEYFGTRLHSSLSYRYKLQPCIEMYRLDTTNDAGHPQRKIYGLRGWTQSSNVKHISLFFFALANKANACCIISIHSLTMYQLTSHG